VRKGGASDLAEGGQRLNDGDDGDDAEEEEEEEECDDDDVMMIMMISSLVSPPTRARPPVAHLPCSLSPKDSLPDRRLANRSRFRDKHDEDNADHHDHDHDHEEYKHENDDDLIITVATHPCSAAEDSPHYRQTSR
jgi:hypothetical protein